MRNRSRAAAVVGVLALSLSLAACGGGDESNGVASLGGGGTQAQGAAQTADVAGDGDGDPYEFAKCMRENGVEDFPDPDANGGFKVTPSSGVRLDDPATEKALEACRDLMGTPAEISDEQRAKLQDAFLAFAKCMRENGVDMPDPDLGSEGAVRMLLPEGVTPDDPTFREAQKACQPVLDAATREAGLPMVPRADS